MINKSSGCCWWEEKSIKWCWCGWSNNKIPDHKLCQRTKNAFKFDIKEMKELTSDSKYLCACCWRSAKDKENLCTPVSF